MTYPPHQQGYQQPGYQQGYQQPGYQQGPQQYGHPGYQPAYPGYSAFGHGEPGGRSNPAAGVLLLIGALAGLAAALIPNQAGNVPVVASFELFGMTDQFGSDSWRMILVACGPIALALGALMALIAGFMMFGAGRHGGAATLGIIGAILMLTCPILLLIATEGKLLDTSLTVGTVLMLGAWLPALIGALVGYRK